MTRLREAHAHIALHGRSSSFVDLAACKSAAEALDRIASASADLEPSQWVIAVGARPEGWSVPGWFSPGDLNEAVGGRPAFVWCFDHHAGMASAAGLAAAEIGGDTPDPAGGTFLRDAAGQPTGVALESAAHAVWSAVPEPTPHEWRGHVRRGLADFVRCGFTEVHELHAPPWLGPMLADLADAGELLVDVTLYEPVADIVAAFDRAEAWQRDNLRLGGGKIFADGTLNSRTAWMLHPYANPV
ncbi:MAG: amidohydrolase family protein, partial [Planctomycetota bacterium]